MASKIRPAPAYRDSPDTKYKTTGFIPEIVSGAFRGNLLSSDSKSHTGAEVRG
jgi:hypothetical protein